MARSDNTCEICGFWQLHDTELSKGICRRKSPTPLLAAGGVDYQDIPVWPYTNADDWCGEFELREGVVGESCDNEIPVDEYNSLGIKARNALDACEVTTLKQLASLNIRSILEVRNTGKSAAEEIAALALRHGITMRR